MVSSKTSYIIHFFLTDVPSLQSSKQSESVKVVVRCRPLSEKEMKAGYERYIYIYIYIYMFMHTRRYKSDMNPHQIG